MLLFFEAFQWADLPAHVRKAVKSLLQGELENMSGGDAKKSWWLSA